ncbi:hypothetical protein SDC9_114765 [bioreactor metagenome]|uniref:Uncharacterized protein n=1 Tax=bioreactor metagenome TaxID=1076179 RepID=A0A645BQX2_9ZZZZ
MDEGDGQLVPEAVDEEMGRVAGDGEKIGSPPREGEEVFLQALRGVLPRAENGAAPVGHLGVGEQVGHGVLLVPGDGRPLRQETEKLRRRRRPHAAEYTENFIGLSAVHHKNTSGEFCPYIIYHARGRGPKMFHNRYIPVRHPLPILPILSSSAGDGLR